MQTRYTTTFLIAAALAFGCKDSNEPQPIPAEVPVVVTGSGDIAPVVASFQTVLGDPLNTTAGEQPAGRREINWDGAGANPFNNRDDFPAGFFNSNVKAGAIFTTPGTGFRNDSTQFTGVNATYGTQLFAFSPKKIFAPVGSNVMDVLFQVAGQPAPALVTGFGAVFADVDVAGGTTIEFFDATGVSLLKLSVPVRSDANGLSFAGARFTLASVARVRITLGTAALSATNADVSSGGTGDVVAVDNFLYGEPKRIP